MQTIEGVVEKIARTWKLDEALQAILSCDEDIQDILIPPWIDVCMRFWDEIL